MTVNLEFSYYAAIIKASDFLFEDLLDKILCQSDPAVNYALPAKMIAGKFSKDIKQTEEHIKDCLDSLVKANFGDRL